MGIFRNLEEIVDYAISREMEEIEFYSRLASRMDRKNVKNLFHNISLEKTARVLRLEKMKDMGIGVDSTEIQDMKIAGSLEDIDYEKTDLSYQEALIIAMKKEKEKFKFYTDMAESAIKDECKKAFLALAYEVAQQKLKFEIEYDEYVLQEN